MCGRGVWCLRHKLWLALTLAGSIAYILLLPGPIAHDRFYLPAIPLVTVFIALGGSGRHGQRRSPSKNKGSRLKNRLP
jgi:hypothetical protein